MLTPRKPPRIRLPSPLLSTEPPSKRSTPVASAAVIWPPSRLMTVPMPPTTPRLPVPVRVIRPALSTVPPLRRSTCVVTVSSAPIDSCAAAPSMISPRPVMLDGS